MTSSSLVLAVCIWSIEHFKMQKIQPFGTLKSYYNNMHKIFNESPSRRADYERILCATKEDYPLFFCSTRWVENANVAKIAQKIWPKLVAVVKYWSGWGDAKQNKSY